MQQTILAPVAALVLWTLVMWVWLYATRLPAMARQKVRLDPQASRAQLTEVLPARVRWKADNYNHLMEQPTIFYAVALTLALVGEGHGLNAWIAWSYVALRIVHSLVQALGNVIMLRFGVFTVSTIFLTVLAVRAAWAVFQG